MAELADAQHSKCCGATRVGSTPTPGINNKVKIMETKQNAKMLPPILFTIAVALAIAGIIFFVNLRKNEPGQPMEGKASLMQEEEEKQDNTTASMESESEADRTPMDESQEQETTQEAMGTDQTQIPEAPTELTFSGEVIAGTSAPLINFNQTDYQKAIKSNKLVVLYFYANWCPICARETREALYPAFNDINSNNIVGFRVNFNDSETDNNEKQLAQQFGITYQHTKVFVKNGQTLLTSGQEWNKERYLTEILQHS